MKMSVLISSVNGWVVSHENYIKTIYSKVIDSSGRHLTMGYSKSIFSIFTPYVFNNQVIDSIDKIENSSFKLKKKRKTNTSIICQDEKEVNDVRDNFNLLLEEAMKRQYFLLCKDEEVSSKNNEDARLSAHTFFNNISELNLPRSNGGNNSNCAIVINCCEHTFIFPPMSTFYCCDVKDFPSKLNCDVKYDLILMDPPWWNKYIRRKKMKNSDQGYRMMYNSDLKELPIDLLLTQEGLVASWCTNSSSHIKYLINNIFPAWGINYIATWYWMKVTKGGKPVCKFNKPPGKQPYERIIFGSRHGRENKYHQPEDKKCIVSVPSAIHSHKPPLTEILSDYLPPSPKCLELFARYLLPHWTSVGDQVLSLQSISLFTEETSVENKL